MIAIGYDRNYVHYNSNIRRSSVKIISTYKQNRKKIRTPYLI